MSQSNSTNYLWEMLASEPSKIASMVWVLLAFAATFFLGLWAIPIFLVLYLGVLGVASMFVPDNLMFRSWVDKIKRSAQRANVRERLLNMISSSPNTIRGLGNTNITSQTGEWVRNPIRQQYDEHVSDYRRMMGRLESLKDLANDPRNPIGAQDIERLEDATIDFLRLFHTQLALLSRVENVDSEDRVRHQLSAIDQQLRDDTIGASERKRMEKSRNELQKLHDQRKRLPGQLAAAEIQLTAMAETFEEIYHRITTNPQAAASAYLEEASSRLAIEEEITSSVEEEMGNLSDIANYRASRAALAARQRQ